MNWDISIGRCKQSYGRLVQLLGQRLNRRAMVMNGERIEYGGRLQARYGLVKHHVQWGSALVPVSHDLPSVVAKQSSHPIGRG